MNWKPTPECAPCALTGALRRRVGKSDPRLWLRVGERALENTTPEKLRCKADEQTHRS
jgi:hypothetical protein